MCLPHLARGQVRWSSRRCAPGFTEKQTGFTEERKHLRDRMAETQFPLNQSRVAFYFTAQILQWSVNTACSGDCVPCTGTLRRNQSSSMAQSPQSPATDVQTFRRSQKTFIAFVPGYLLQTSFIGLLKQAWCYFKLLLLVFLSYASPCVARATPSTGTVGN